MRPDQTSSMLRRLADMVDGERLPSRRAVAAAAGRIVTALEGSGATPREGAFAVPDAEVVAHLGKWLTAKYTIDAAYRSFSDRVKGPWRDSLVDHWYKHAEEERRQGYDLAMKIVAIGGDPIQTSIQVPPATANLGGFCMALMDLELKAIENGRVAIQMAGDNAPLRVLAEQIIYTDAQHLDDLRRMAATFDMGAGA